MPICSIPTSAMLAPNEIKRLEMDNNEKNKARFSARIQANPGTVRFCNRTTSAAILTASLYDSVSNKSVESQGAVNSMVKAIHSEVNDKSTTTVERTPMRSL